MSKYLIVQTQMIDGDAIKEALKELGYVFEEHKNAQHLYGYMGDVRSQKAHIIVRRRYVGAGANDVGFLRKEDGSYEIIISEFDKSMSQGKAFLNKLKPVYGKHHVLLSAKKMGLVVKSQKTKGNKLKISCSYRG